MAGQPIWVFDGVCVLCSASVRFLLDHERGPAVRFVIAQGPLGRRLLSEHGLDPEQPVSHVVIDEGRVWLRSDAACRLARQLRWPWRWLGLIGWLPRALRDRLYDLVARNRYRWFGRRAECLVPPPELRARFLT